MGVIQLTAHPRTTTGKNANRRTRAAGRIPAVIYGVRSEPTTCEVDAAEFAKAFGSHANAGSILSLTDAATGVSTVALLREVQRHPVADMIYHIDLFEIPTDRPITVEVAVELRGESKSVKSGDAAVLWPMHRVEVSCLPAEVPESIVVDISGLKTGDKVHVSDLSIERGKIVSSPEDLVLQLQSTALFAAAETPVVTEEAAEGAEGEESAGAAAGEGAKAEKAEKAEKADKGKGEKDKGEKKK